MRYIFYFLLGANVLLLAWGLLVSPDGRATASAPADSMVNPASGVEVVRLLAAGGGEVSPAPESPEEPPEPETRVHCDTIGPLHSGRKADELAREIRAAGAVVRMFSRQGELQRDYWVLLPPLRSRQEALLRFQEFQSRNVDSFVITQGDMANAISLGLFTRKPLAEDLQARLRSMGYPEVEVREVPRENQEIWLRVVSREAGEAGWRQVMEGRPEPVRRESVCEEGLLSGLHALEFGTGRAG